MGLGRMQNVRVPLARRVDRRTLLGTAGGLALLAADGRAAPAVAQTPTDLTDELTIDLAVEPPTLDPALVHEIDGWSVVHSVYDSLVQYGPSGQLEPLLAESLTQPDPLTYEIKLRPGVTFHNGEPLDSRAVAFSVAHILDPATKSPVVDNFKVIAAVEEIDPSTAHLKLTQPAPWLPAQIAAWLLILPPEYAADPANDFGANPVGTGPYRFVGWERGATIRLEANPDYVAASPKGRPIARQVAFRFVLEPSTRVADLLAGTAGLVREVAIDQADAVRDNGAEVREQPISGSTWIRFATGTPPFDDVRVRQALNYAVDVDAIIQALLGGNGKRLASPFVETSLGYDPSLAPYPYDPDRARALLAEAGLPDGFETALDYVATEREDVIMAVAGQLAEVGVRATITPVETATFSAHWTPPEAAPLRFLSWRPLFDPYTLLSLVFSNKGYLSAYDSPNAQPLIDAGATEVDPAKRAEVYRRLARVFSDEPAAIYLYNLTALYGVAPSAAAWTARPDEYIVPTHQG